MPGFLIQKVMTPSSPQALRVVAWGVLPCLLDDLGCLSISSDTCTGTISCAQQQGIEWRVTAQTLSGRNNVTRLSTDLQVCPVQALCV